MPKTKGWRVSDGLNLRQRLFVKEYLKDLNAAQAVRRAGYKAKMPEVMGHQLMQKPEVIRAIQKEINERFKSVEITADNVLKEIAKMAFANIMDYIQIHDDGTYDVDFSTLTRDQAAAIQEVHVDEKADGSKSVRFKMADKKSALELLGRYFKLFTDKHEITGKDGDDLVKQLPDFTKMNVDELHDYITGKLLAKRAS